jgi:Effector-associated domain 5
MESKKHLSEEQVRQIVDAAVLAGLAQSRGALLAGVDRGLVMELPAARSGRAQLLVDLAELNRITTLADGTVPLVDWLNNAILLAGPRLGAEVFRAALEAVKSESEVEPRLPSLPRREPEEVSLERAPEMEKRLLRGLVALDVDEFWARPEASSLLEVLQVAYDTLSRIQRVAAVAGVGMGGVRVGGSIADIWFDLLSAAIRAAKLNTLLEIVQRDPSIAGYHLKIRGLIT